MNPTWISKAGTSKAEYSALYRVYILQGVHTRELPCMNNNNIMDLWANLGSLMGEVDDVKLKSPAKSAAI